MSIRRTAILLLSSLLLVSVTGLLWGEDLWRDHNPYNPYQPLQKGSILKIFVNEPVVVEYEYDSKREQRVVIKTAPDKKTTPFLPGVNTEKNYQGNRKAKLKSKSQLKINMAVTIQSIAGDTVNFQGLKVIAYEAGRVSQTIRVLGAVHRKDISDRRIILSEHVAGLQVQMNGGPEVQTKNIPIKTIPGQPGQPARPSAELSDREKQQLLLEYLNRILGESKDD